MLITIKIVKAVRKPGADEIQHKTGYRELLRDDKVLLFPELLIITLLFQNEMELLLDQRGWSLRNF